MPEACNRQVGMVKSQNMSAANRPSGTSLVCRNSMSFSASVWARASGAGLVLPECGGGHDDAPAAAARLAPTTVMVALSASVGLNSTTSVPAVMTGVCPAGA